MKRGNRRMWFCLLKCLYWLLKTSACARIFVIFFCRLLLFGLWNVSADLVSPWGQGVRFIQCVLFFLKKHIWISQNRLETYAFSIDWSAFLHFVCISNRIHCESTQSLHLSFCCWLSDWDCIKFLQFNSISLNNNRYCPPYSHQCLINL